MNSPSIDQVYLVRNRSRLQFSEMLTKLPPIKGNQRYPDIGSTLTDYLNENMSTVGKTSITSRLDGISKSELSQSYKHNYFSIPDDNLFSPMKQTKASPLEPMAFVLTQPDHRIRKNLFENKLAV